MCRPDVFQDQQGSEAAAFLTRLPVIQTSHLLVRYPQVVCLDSTREPGTINSKHVNLCAETFQAKSFNSSFAHLQRTVFTGSHFVLDVSAPSVSPLVPLPNLINFQGADRNPASLSDSLNLSYLSCMYSLRFFFPHNSFPPSV